MQNANDQAATAAHTVAGVHKPYVALPWFWSDQYDCKLQIAGLNTGYDAVVLRPGKSERSQSVWYYRGEQLLAVDAMSDPAAFVTAKKLLERGGSVPPAQAADPSSRVQDLGSLTDRWPRPSKSCCGKVCKRWRRSCMRRAGTSRHCIACRVAPARRPGPSTSACPTAARCR